MTHFLNLIRWKNLLIIVFVQLLIKYALLEPFGVNTSLNFIGICLLTLATICIAAAGYIINDIYDIETDLINKPGKNSVGKIISKRTAFNLFAAFNVIGVVIGFYISNLIGKSAFFSFFVIISILLYVYASFFKQKPLIGNIIISLLVSSSILIVGIFELIPTINHENHKIQITFFKIIFHYSIFAFIINLLREIVKDIEDFDGDYKTGMNTLPIAIGKTKTKTILFALSCISTFIISYYVVNSLYKNIIAVIYFLLLIIGPLIYTTIKIWNAKTKNDYQHVSKILKMVMVFGILSLILYTSILLK